MPRERITRAALDLAIGALNRELGRDPGTTGSYEIVGAYGGWQLVTVGPAPACGAVDHAPVPAGHGFHSRRAIYDAVQCIRHGIAIGRGPAGAELRPGTLAAIADLMESMEYVDGDPVATGTETDWAQEWESLDRLRSRPTTGTLAAESVARAELSAWVQGHECHMPNAAADVVADLDDAAQLAYRAANAVTVQLTRADAGLLSAALDAAATRAMHDSHTASDENDVVEFERLRDTRYALDRLALAIYNASKEAAL
jgi:hypothetical protein